MVDGRRMARRALHRWLRSGTIVGLALLLALVLLSPRPLLAQGGGPLPAGPDAPDHPDTWKVAPSVRSGPVPVMIELTDAPAVVAATQGGGPRALSASAARSQAAL